MSTTQTRDVVVLDKHTIEIIKATVPVLQVHGEAISIRFYERLFLQHPELRNVFNQTNQRMGRQQTALAGAVYAAALHIDDLSAILHTVRHISEKHRSLGVKPQHYPIVGENLLAAIGDVLGEAATAEIMTAWGKAYGYIAQAFIAVEREMYQDTTSQRGGWSGFRPFVVENKIVESDVITSFYLQPADGHQISEFIPGQYVSVRVQLDVLVDGDGSTGSHEEANPAADESTDVTADVHTHIRQYSLSDAPGKPYYRISVKREVGLAQHPSGVVSNYLHRQVEIGDVIQLSAPAGEFGIDMKSTRPLLLVSGRVGITPIMSMLQTVAQRQPTRQVTFLHASLNGNVQAFGHTVEAIQAEHADVISVHVCYERPTAEDMTAQPRRFAKGGFINSDYISAILESTDVDCYLCGPTPFMKAMYSGLQVAGVAANRIHYEFFGPGGSLESS